MKILVTYATCAGSTAEVARAIGDEFSGVQIDVLPIADVTDITPFEAVVIGSPLHSGQWLPEAHDFVDTHRYTLARIPAALFVTAMRLRHDDPDIRRIVLQYIQPVCIAVKPVAVGLLAGCMDYSKLSAIMRLQVQTKGLPEGDFRDWDAIRTWAARLPSLLANGEQV
jgi:menaquinone-dependent protoporphyrinogen oxidase